ncbi:MAG: polysaccharide ABC transporter ATP-binding protein [Chitinophagaceae bacterium]
MSNTVVKVENVSKQYRLGEVGTGTLKDDLKSLYFKIRGKENPLLQLGEENDRTTKSNSQYVWALKDINFDIKQGDVVGIIGRNGAGKSTLLKILSRTTGPTTGSISIKGRVASLLEVGTGFHPELSGRENIFLNGAIMGLRKVDIQKRFDAIIDFAGVERYLDTPVKRYSSGMYVRLAFAVAAHLEPDILIVDEVLAVGDAEFQKKCMGKIGDVSKADGRTVIFVSHNMAAVKSLCNKGIVLKNGLLRLDDTADKAVSYYLNDGGTTLTTKIFNDIYKKNSFIIHSISVKNNPEKASEIILETSVTIEEAENDEKAVSHITFHLINELGEPLFSFASPVVKLGKQNLICHFPANFFQSGSFYLTLFVISKKSTALLVEKDIFSFTVIDGGRELGQYMGREPGFIRPQFEWTVNSLA